ncbi:hypothetical protein E3P89_01955 [Wallemia ichthyophaga]|uniref:Uncharacterized protein n=1 Tax=Wallemia ichthyophaga TaxID=245174 RepID=A0A4T0HCT8_WALIC|nr:hypothetical protein E3P98_00142 [Wallemia ichthyophaga]TIB04322.1 hypothetical protein E3P95_00209 [Wallemia ichthyophaga]TIB05353.1 hypothetical protein E3P94_00209 [Wallemia ichthyophaga]TIB11616.1 hypothetical protein E3P93_02556 [Wallemia ichthyophaga]TIB11901.1 hypothetical protein E3P90_02248 [Wallemia ichthyophaga]
MTPTYELAQFLRETGPEPLSSPNKLRKMIDKYRSKSSTQRSTLPAILIDYKESREESLDGRAPRDTNMSNSAPLNPASNPAKSFPAASNITPVSLTPCNITTASHDKLVNLVHCNDLLKEHSRRLAAEQRALRAEELARLALNRLSRYE